MDREKQRMANEESRKRLRRERFDRAVELIRKWDKHGEKLTNEEYSELSIIEQRIPDVSYKIAFLKAMRLNGRVKL